MSETFDRSQLDGKDRDQLSQIASALGVKATSRMRKADLVDAIVGAAAGGESSSSPANSSGRAAPRKIRSRRVVDDDIASIAEEQNALADSGGSDDDMTLIRPRRRATTGNGQSTGDANGHGASGSGSDSDFATSTTVDTDDAHERAAADGAHPNDRPVAAHETVNERSVSRQANGPAPQTEAPQGRDSGDHTEGDHTDHADADGSGDRSGSGQQWRDDDSSANKRRRRRRGRDRERSPGDTRVAGGDGRPDRVERTGDDYNGELVEIEGLLDLRDEGYGFLRASGYLAGRNDAYVSASQVRRFGLRKGDHVKGATRPPASSEKYPALVRVDLINDVSIDEARHRVRFEDLTPLFPDSRLKLELGDAPGEITGRIIDLIAPIGKGQRGMIVSPPKAGKTTIIKQIVYSIERNNPECHVIVLLVDERPEEVTDMRRHVLRADVVASTFDRPSDEHCHIAELTIERAKRLVECGKDVVIILDGITRLARAYNLAAPASGRIMSGGIDAGALYPPKKFFGAARNVEEGGSLTILATALVETNSKMDEHIFEEFKGTGNMELRLDRRMADRRIYPAIDVEQSGTRHEELLFDRHDIQQVYKLRRVLSALEGGSGLELLIDKLRSTKSNTQFLMEIAKAPTGMGT
jgi:transcription termination factor Rho